MNASDPTYYSVARSAVAELVVKRSRFIAYVFPVDNEEEALGKLAEVKAAHSDASHVCYAYKAGLAGEAVRCSDAGEPAGTAGRPILEAINRAELSNTLVAVVRYFGGILLGAGGLIRAYNNAAVAGLEAAGKAEYVLHNIYAVRVDYHQYGRIDRLLTEMGYKLEETVYSELVEFRLAVPVPQSNLVLTRLSDAAGGRIEVEEKACVHRPMSAIPD